MRVIAYPSHEFSKNPEEYKVYNVVNANLFEGICALREGWPGFEMVEAIVVTKVGYGKYDGEVIFDRDNFRNLKYKDKNYKNILFNNCSDAVADFQNKFSENPINCELHIIIDDSEAYKRDLEASYESSCRCGCGTRGSSCKYSK